MRYCAALPNFNFTFNFLNRICGIADWCVCLCVYVQSRVHKALDPPIFLEKKITSWVYICLLPTHCFYNGVLNYSSPRFFTSVASLEYSHITPYIFHFNPFLNSKLELSQFSIPSAIWEPWRNAFSWLLISEGSNAFQRCHFGIPPS